MPLTDLIQRSKKYEIQSYKKQFNYKTLKKTHVPFTGSPQKHSYDHEKVKLLIDPFGSNTEYFEFKTKDIYHVEELPNIVNMDEEVVTMVRIWVKKGSLAIRSLPFIVEDLKI